MQPPRTFETKIKPAERAIDLSAFVRLIAEKIQTGEITLDREVHNEQKKAG